MGSKYGGLPAHTEQRPWIFLQRGAALMGHWNRGKVGRVGGSIIGRPRTGIQIWAILEALASGSHPDVV